MENEKKLLALLNLLNFKQHAEHRKSFTELLSCQCALPTFQRICLSCWLGHTAFAAVATFCVCLNVTEGRARDLYAVDLHVKNKGKIVTQIIFNKSLEMWAIVRFVLRTISVLQPLFLNFFPLSPQSRCLCDKSLNRSPTRTRLKNLFVHLLLDTFHHFGVTPCHKQP